LARKIAGIVEDRTVIQLSVPEQKYEKDKTPAALIVGALLTIIWLVLVAVYLSTSTHTWTDLWSLEANNFGDFLAGAFAPVAFL
jgi:hypothetical protein